MAKLAKTTKKIATPKVEVEEVETTTVETEEIVEAKIENKVEEVVVKTRANSGIDVN